MRHRSAKRAMVAGVLALAAATLALDWGAARSAYLRDPMYADKLTRLRKHFGESPPASASVVFLGSSRAAYGFDALRVEKDLGTELGRPAIAFNFGVPASGPLTCLLYARRLLADGVRPDLLLVEVMPPLLADRPDGPAELHWLRGNRLWKDEIDLLVRHGCPAEPLRESWRESWLVPAFSLRFPVLGRIQPSAVPWNLRMDCCRITDAGGWLPPGPTAPTPEQYRQGLAQARAEYADLLADFRPDGHAARAFAELLAVAHTAGVPTTLVLMPEGHDFRSLYPSGALARLDDFLATLGVPLIDARGWIDDDGFSDSHHLLRAGAEAFSERLARSLGPRSSQPQSGTVAARAGGRP